MSIQPFGANGEIRLPLPRTTTWDLNESALFDTTIISAPAAPDAAANIALDMSMASETDLEAFPPLGTGSFARVYEVGGFAVKVFSEDDVVLRRAHGSLSGLAVNVALHCGLKRYPNGRHLKGWELSAPEIFAAAFPAVDDSKHRNITWVMQKIIGERPQYDSPIPQAPHRHGAYRKALKYSGLITEDVIIDDDADNMRISFAKKKGEKDRLVKFDVYTPHNLLSRYG